MTSTENFQLLESFCRENGIALFGTCSVEKLKSTFHLTTAEIGNVKHAISIGIRLSQAVLDGIENFPTHLYKWHYRQANIQLDKLAFLLSLKIQEMGFHALPIPASQIIDWRKQIGHLSHRHIAVEAGLGWLGRNNLLVTKEYGSQFRLVTILTDMVLPQGQQQSFQCGECYECAKVCPAKAIGETAKDHNFHKCFELLDYFCKKKNLNLHICGICVRACRGTASR